MVPTFMVIILLVDIFNLHKGKDFIKLVIKRCAEVTRNSGPQGFYSTSDR